MGGNVIAVGMDVTCASSVAGAIRATFDGLGGLDAIVNSAGIIRITPLAAVSDRDVVNAVLFFLSSESSFITGQVLYVDGGLTRLRALADIG